jgi:antitoxin MazE
MRRKVQKWGNSLAIRVPKPFAREIGLEQDSEVDISLADGQLVVSPVEVHSYTLEGLLAGVTQDNLHGEVFTGPAVGNEAW